MRSLSVGSVPGAAKALGFVVALGVVFGAALGIGHAAGPLPDEESAKGHQAEHVEDSEDAADATATDAGHGSTHAGSSVTTKIPGGLMVAQDGYRLRLSEAQASRGSDVPVSFVIEAPGGDPLTSYDVEHEKRLHLIAVRRDFRGFQHVHPELAADGTWSTRLDLTPGAWRLFADFKPTGGDPLTLGTDLTVAGDYQPAGPDAESRTFEADGYTVALDGDLSAGADARLTVSVSNNGRPVTDLQPYLGAYGHLVALREGDLAYLHVHPDGHPGDGSTVPGPKVVFYAGVPSEGRYRLFLDFRHDGVVRTAEFTVDTSGTAHTGERSNVTAEEDAHEHD